MTAWMDLVKRLSKENPGKPLQVILPLAKKLYRKPVVKPQTKRFAPNRKMRAKSLKNKNKK
jgi:hypothetical protein